MTQHPADNSDTVRRRLGLRLEATGIRVLTVTTDAIPPRYRFGHWNRVLDLLASRDGLPFVEQRSVSELPVSAMEPAPGPFDLRCLVVAGALDTGGVESVVATLARGLPSHGFQTEVVCSTDGRTARALREQGIQVTQATAEDLPALVRARRPDVIQLHRIDVPLLTALRPYAGHTVPVFHAMESYLDRAAWGTLADFTADSPAGIAVSESVARFFGARLSALDIHVVVNGVRPPADDLLAGRATERDRLASALGLRFGPDDVVVVGLQRFSDQKNAAGLVDAFLLAAEYDPRLRLVVAGAPNNWLEVRRADLLRRSHPLGHRVHLLGDSDPWTLLLAGDLYALNSFAEGGPVSAVEAVSCGLPVVLSDVGFARQLVDAADVPGIVVDRANPSMSQAALAAQRRRTHQSNRDAFAGALLELAGPRPVARAAVPELFTERAMVSGHASVLHNVAERSSS